MKVLQSVPARRSRRGHRPRSTMSQAVVGLLSTTARRRIQTQRTNRSRAVFVYRAPTVELTDDSEPGGPRRGSARLTRLRNREPFNPVGATMLRPVADATNTLSILREIIRGPR